MSEVPLNLSSGQQSYAPSWGCGEPRTYLESDSTLPPREGLYRHSMLFKHDLYSLVVFQHGFLERRPHSLELPGISQIS